MTIQEENQYMVVFWWRKYFEKEVTYANYGRKVSKQTAEKDFTIWNQIVECFKKTERI